MASCNKEHAKKPTQTQQQQFHIEKQRFFLGEGNYPPPNQYKEPNINPIAIVQIAKSWRIFFQNEKAAMFGLAFAFESYIPLQCPKTLSQHSHRECCWYPASHGVGTEPAGVSQRDWCGGCGVNANDR